MTSTAKTKCPNCHTIYTVPTEKLKEPKAKANCGKCKHTFLLNLHLLDESLEATKSTNQSISNSAKVSDNTTQKTFHDNMDNDKSDISFDGLDSFLKQNNINTHSKSKSFTAAPANQDDENWLDNLLKNDDSPNIATKSASHSIQQGRQDEFKETMNDDFVKIIPVAENPLAQNPELLTKKMEERLSQNPNQNKAKNPYISTQFGWALGSFLLLSLLISQYILFNGDNIAKEPSRAGPLLALCPLLNCPMNSADLKAFRFSHHITNGDSQYNTNLMGTIKNTSSVDQLYPNLKITVHGANNILGEMALAPEDYLISKQRLLVGEQERQFLLTLDINRQYIKSINIEPFY